MARAATTMTFKEFERLPDEPGKCELLEGELIQLPPAMRKHKGNDYFEGGPALAVEIISESNTAEKMDAEIAAYLAAGTLEAWVVYPKTQRTWKYRPNQSAELITNSITSDLLPGFSIDLPDLLNV